MSLFYFDAVTMSCHDQQVTASWWERVFDCRRAPVPDYWDESEDCVALLFPGMAEPTICLSPKARDKNQYPVPIIFSDNINKAHQKLTERGIAVGPVQGDAPKFFEIRDPEGNTIEVSEEP